jgi:hypothetical protein
MPKRSLHVGERKISEPAVYVNSSETGSFQRVGCEKQTASLKKSWIVSSYLRDGNMTRQEMGSYDFPLRVSASTSGSWLNMQYRSLHAPHSPSTSHRLSGLGSPPFRLCKLSALLTMTRGLEQNAATLSTSTPLEKFSFFSLECCPLRCSASF